MLKKEVEVEFVKYRVNDVAEAAVALIHNFARYSGIFGAEQWVGAIVHLLEIIKNQKAKDYILSAEGVDVSFSGFPNPNPIIDFGRQLVLFRPREPYFVIKDRLADILPRRRTNVLKVTEEIAEEMNDIYHLRVNSNPLTLTFPKEEYAKEIQVFNATLLI